MPLDFGVEGEVQFDCAVAPEVASLKAPNSTVAGKSILLFSQISMQEILGIKLLLV